MDMEKTPQFRPSTLREEPSNHSSPTGKDLGIVPKIPEEFGVEAAPGLIFGVGMGTQICLKVPRVLFIT